MMDYEDMTVLELIGLSLKSPCRECGADINETCEHEQGCKLFEIVCEHTGDL